MEANNFCGSYLWWHTCKYLESSCVLFAQDLALNHFFLKQHGEQPYRKEAVSTSQLKMLKTSSQPLCWESPMVRVLHWNQKVHWHPGRPSQEATQTKTAKDGNIKNHGKIGCYIEFPQCHNYRWFTPNYFNLKLYPFSGSMQEWSQSQNKTCINH